jgi:hypothetical protein
VLVANGLLQGQADSAMSTGDPFRLLLFHDGPVRRWKGEPPGVYVSFSYVSFHHTL